MSVPGPCSRQPEPLAAGVFEPEIGSFRVPLAMDIIVPEAERTLTCD